MNDICQTNFENDLREHLLSELTGMGYEAEESESVFDLLCARINIHHRQISEKKRVVHEIPALDAPASLQGGYALLKGKLINGEDITSHLSRLLKKRDFNDAMLNDWGIYHFHLGENLEDDGYVNRTDPVLYAFVTKTDFYTIGFFSHGQWADKDIVEKIHEVWPDLLIPFRAEFNSSQIKGPTMDDRAKLRRNNINAVTEVSDGTCYFSPGGGYQSNGISLAVVAEANQTLNVIRNAEKGVRSNFEKILDSVKQKGLTPGPNPEIRCDFTYKGDKEIRVIETSTGASIYIPLE